MEPILARPHPAGMGGVQKIYRFDNGFGASVVRFFGSYGYKEGLWELAVLEFNGPEPDDSSLTYDTPITDDVLGHLTWKEVEKLLESIAGLEEEK